jgi:cell division septum initiation protein DivIVA
MGLRKKKSLIDRATDYVESAKPQIESAVAGAKDRATPLISEARDKAAPVISDARGKAAPLIADAREKVGPVVADARTKAGPVIAEGAAVAADKAAIGAALAAEKAALGRDLATAKAAEIRSESRKGGKLKKLLLFGGLAAAAGVAYNKLRGQSESDNWQSSYTPTPAPSSGATPPVATEPADDSAGSSPDEALADSTGEPHPVSTPDDPAEVISLEDESDAGSKPSHKA